MLIILIILILILWTYQSYHLHIKKILQRITVEEKIETAKLQAELNYKIV